jgi:fatty acid desaturase
LLFLNNNYHLVHHDLPHVPWFALRRVFEMSRQQYIERSGGFLVKGYSEWLRLYAFASVAYPVYGNPSDAIQENPPAADSFTGKLRVNS